MFFTPAFKTYTTGGIVVGPASQQLYETCLAAMFAHVTTLERWPLQPGTVVPDVDAIIVARELDAVAARQEGATTTFRFDVSTFFELYEPSGERIADWKSTGSATERYGPFRARLHAWELIVPRALRGAAAQFMVEFPRVSDVHLWLEARGLWTKLQPLEHAGPIRDATSAVVLPFSVLEERTDVMDCVVAALEGVTPHVRVMPLAAFRGALFPWFEHATAPYTPEEMMELLQYGAIRERLAANDARWLIGVKGSTTQEERGWLECSSAPPAGGCLGLLWGARESVFQATIWDARVPELVGSRTATSKGTRVVPALYLPIPFTPPTERNACRELADFIAPLIVENGKR